MKTYLLAMFYGPVLPLVFPITVLSLIAEYWMIKTMLLRRYARPPYLSYHIDKAMINMVVVGIFLFAYANFMFHSSIN
jgi:hypothetical protein